MKKIKKGGGAVLVSVDRIDDLKCKIVQLLNVVVTSDDLKVVTSGIESKIDGVGSRIDGMATKADLEKAVAKMVTTDHFNRSVRMLVTKVEFDDFKEYLAENMYTKADQNKLLTILDPMSLEFKRTRRSNILTGKQLCEMDDKINMYEHRIRILEEKT